MSLRAPFPYFGGKSAIAAQVWRWLGDVPNYVEPFFGSGAVLLGRPDYDAHRHTETVNDADGLLCNFWRAVTADAEAVAQWADWPVNENDLHARHAWLVGQKDALQTRLEGDPDYYDTKIAGWWVWGICCWIGRQWCNTNGPWQRVNGELVHRSDAGQGIHRSIVFLNRPGQGMHSKLVAADAPHQGLQTWFQALQARLRRVRVCCGNWQRVCGASPTIKLGLTGVFLDPPYSHNRRDAALYRVEADIAPAIQQWCLTHGANAFFRIVLCGYSDEHDVLIAHGWRKWSWKNRGGYGSQSTGQAREHAAMETVWYSPHCVGELTDLPLFARHNGSACGG